MAVVPYTSVSTGHTNVGVFKWSATSWAKDDYGDPVALAPFADRTVHAWTVSPATAGAFEIQGSLDGVTWFTIEDSQGQNLAFTHALLVANTNGTFGKAETVGPATLYIRPYCTTATSTPSGSPTWNIVLLCKGFS